MTDGRGARSREPGVRWWALAMAVVLAGCGGSGNKPEEIVQADKAPVVAAKPAAIDRTGWPVIVAFGDSLTAGFGVEPGKSYPDVLQQMLDANGYKYRVVNEGVSGDTTTNGLARVDAVIGDKPEIVILELGGNDGLRGVPPKEIHANLERIIQQLQKAGPKILLAGITLPPNYGSDYIRAFEGNYTSLTKQYRLSALPFFYQGVLDTEGFLQQDGIHATVKGNQRVAKNVYEALKPLLSSKRATAG